MCLKNIKHSRESNIPYNPLDTSCLTGFEDTCDYIELEESKNIKIQPQDLTILQMNIHGLISKQDGLSKMLFDIIGVRALDIVILCETWLASKSEKKICIPGYVYHGIPRKHKKGGGVAFLIKEGIKFKEVLTLDDADVECESCFVELTLGDSRILLGSLYRPLNTSTKSFLEYYSKLSERINNDYKSYIIGLDHNLNLLNHENHKDTQTFLEMIIDHEQYPCITRPTRLTHHSATLLDNIILPKNFHTKSHSGIIISDLSDHLPCLAIISNVKKHIKINKVIKKRNMSEKKINEMVAKLKHTDFDKLLSEGDVNDSINVLHTTILNCINTVSPLREITISTNKTVCEPWLTKGLRKCSHRQLKLYKANLEGKDPNCHEKYKQYRDFLKKT